MVRRLCASFVLAACTAKPAPQPTPTPPPIAAPPPVAAAPRTDFETRLDALATWLQGQPGVDRVARWGVDNLGGANQFTWVRDQTGSTWCHRGELCWTEPARPELITGLSTYGSTSSLDAFHLAWGPENGRIEAWEFDPRAAKRRRLGELVIRSREPLPFWWAHEQIELGEPGKPWTLPALTPPTFAYPTLTPAGPPATATPWPTIPAPPWVPVLAGLEVWPFRSSTGAVAFSVTPAGTSPGTGDVVGVCARLDRWRCLVLARPTRPVDDRAPVRAELVGPDTIAVEIAELDELDQDTPMSGDYPVAPEDLTMGNIFARAELHVLTLDAGQQRSVGAMTLGGAQGPYASLGMYRSEIDLDYRFLRRAYHPWSVAAGCIRIDALRGEDIALDADFAPLSDLEAKQWRLRSGVPLPRPRRPTALSPEAARAVVARVALLEPHHRVLEPEADPVGSWQLVAGKLVRAPDGACGP